MIHSYNDADGYFAVLSTADEAYMRGARIRKGDGTPRDCQKFYLAKGVAENWTTLAVNLKRIPAAIPVGFRIIDMDSVPDGWETVTVRGRTYPDFRQASVRTKYRTMLVAFRQQHPRITWIDVPFPFAPSNEPSITEADCAELGGGDVEAGKDAYFKAAKWMIDLYVEIFGRAVVGNLVSPSWIREVLLPYQQSKGIRAFRHDSWMRFAWRDLGDVEGENRASLYDAAIALLGGRDKFDRLIMEQTGNGLTVRNGTIVDQGKDKMPCPVWNDMMGSGGECVGLVVTDYGNMGLKAPAPISWNPMSIVYYRSWYDYIEAEQPPGDGGTDPEPPGEYVTRAEFEAYKRANEEALGLIRGQLARLADKEATLQNCEAENEGLYERLEAAEQRAEDLEDERKRVETELGLYIEPGKLPAEITRLREQWSSGWRSSTPSSLNLTSTNRISPPRQTRRMERKMSEHNPYFPRWKRTPEGTIIDKGDKTVITLDELIDVTNKDYATMCEREVALEARLARRDKWAKAWKRKARISKQAFALLMQKYQAEREALRQVQERLDAAERERDELKLSLVSAVTRRDQAEQRAREAEGMAHAPPEDAPSDIVQYQTEIARLRAQVERLEGVTEQVEQWPRERLTSNICWLLLRLVNDEADKSDDPVVLAAQRFMEELQATAPPDTEEG